jgi:very-short-patch-repair endonuclease
MNTTMDKGAALLSFFKQSATIRRKRVSSYKNDKDKDLLLWFADVPSQRAECRSPFLSDNPTDQNDFWLEVRKKRKPIRPSVPVEVKDWVRSEDLDLIESEPYLHAEITVLVEQQVQDHDAPSEVQRTAIETRPRQLRLADHPEVQEAWLEYIVSKWAPWAKEMRNWQEVQSVYERLDFMRNRIEEAEERYELLLAVGLLQWRDPTGTDVKRHFLTFPAEITLDAARGLLTVLPAASSSRFEIEDDMLEIPHRPRLNHQTIVEQLEELNVQGWNSVLVAPILHEIANCLRADAQVREETFKPADRAEDYPLLLFAPALVLRERLPIAYDNLISKFMDFANVNSLKATEPWMRLLREGEPPSDAIGEPGANQNDRGLGLEDFDRYLFPLPANEEQRQIIHRLRAEPCVLVKGPPGTGKSHTIANLICHLLAMGQRVLVTAHAPKALDVLRGLLPDAVRDLSVTSLGSSREDQRLLGESVGSILARKDQWRGAENAQRSIDEAEKNLHDYEGQLAVVERKLRELREAETYPHNLPNGYQGTAAQIARKLQELRDDFGWFPDSLLTEDPFPLDASEVNFLAEVHAHLTTESQQELQMEVGDAPLIDRTQFKELIDNLTAAEQAAGKKTNATTPEKLDLLRKGPPQWPYELRIAIQALDDLALRATRVLGDLTETIFADLLAGRGDRWNRLESEAQDLLNKTVELIGKVGEITVELPNDLYHDKLRTDVQRLLVHLEQGGRRGISIFSPQLVKETRYVSDLCRVDGQKAHSVEQLRCVLNRLQLERCIQDLRGLWMSALLEPSSPKQTARQAEDLTNELGRLLEFFQSGHARTLDSVALESRATLASSSQRKEWLEAITVELAIRDARSARETLDETLETIHRFQNRPMAHPCLNALAEAVKGRDVGAWTTAWEEREKFRRQKLRLDRYNDLLERLDGLCHGLASLLRSTAGNPEWQKKLREIQQAWAWSSARTWLRRVSDPSAYKQSVQDFHRLQQKVEKATEELVSRRAWYSFLTRLDERTVQNLNAYTQSISRLGKGTGKHAYRDRNAARKYLMSCLPRIPAWIMPLHRLWDSVDAVPGLFDTVIVDEASQASVESLALLLLAKRIIVVGDDQQNSPEAIGVLGDDIVRLQKDHLSQFEFRAEFRPDSSFFDHAKRAFGSVISLREHFRCVPEIIRFSNDLCYSDAPLIPLRQAPPNRLKPLESRFIPQGACQGEGTRIRNQAEAEALVDTIVSLLADDRYEGKTMGVIALQGREQAKRIEEMLAQRLDPKTIEERRLRCGEPATFQGDQRDVILLSLVIAPNVHYRALSRVEYVRRFNVAMSRARDQVWLFHSVELHDLGPGDLRHRLVRFFNNPKHDAIDALCENLDELERQARSPRRRGTQPDPYESWFEVDVALEILRRKFAVRPQVEFAGKWLDLVVEGIDARLAVECDGDEWHGPDQYDRDMARQRQLERAGWTFIRVRESEFYADRETAAKTIFEACEELGIYPLDYLEQHPLQPSPSAPVNAESAQNTFSRPELITEHDAKDDPIEDDLAENDSAEDNPNEVDGPFTGYSKAQGFPDPRDASPAKVRAALRQIIETDGPLSRLSVYQLYVEGCPYLQRVGKTVRQNLNRALGAMLKASEISQKDELGDGSPEGLILRLTGDTKVQVRPRGKRDLLEIPPSELLAIMRHTSRESRQSPDDDERLFRMLLDHYGFSHLTGKRRSYLSKVVQLLRQSDQDV